MKNVKPNLYAIVLFSILTLSLYACGGGGGGGSAPAVPLSLTGTISSSSQAPVSGATVTAVNSDGTTAGSTTTDANGRYNLRGLPSATALKVVATGPAGTFPAQAEGITLTAGVVSVLDLYLPSSDLATIKEGTISIWQSQAEIHGPLYAYVDLATAVGTPTVYAAPFDVSAIGNGFPTYSVSPLAIGVDEILELYAAGAFSVSGATFTTADLYLPVPAALIAAAAAADDISGTDTDELYRFDTTTSSWVVTGIDPALTLDPSGYAAFKATVDQAGLYRVGSVLTGIGIDVTEVTGTVSYLDASPAAGVTVYATGSDYGYQQIVTTDDTGSFTVLTKTGGTTDYEVVAWGYGLQLTASGSPPTITLPFDQPVNGVPAPATITVDELGTFGPVSIALIAASGRLIDNDPQTFDGAALRARADIAFNADTIDGLTISTTDKGSGILEVATPFDSLTSAPASGYVTATALPVGILAPKTYVVQTGNGYAKISVDDIIDNGGNSWTLEIRAAFSNTGAF